MEKEIKKLIRKFLGKKVSLNKLYYGAMDILKINIFTDERVVDKDEEQIIFHKQLENMAMLEIIIKYKTIQKHFTGDIIEIIDIKKEVKLCPQSIK